MALRLSELRTLAERRDRKLDEETLRLNAKLLEEEQRTLALHSLLKKPKYSDSVVITCDGRSIDVHRCFLASQSSYFAAIFSSNCRESASRCVIFEDLSFKTLNPILEEMYGKSIEITNDNFQDLLVISDRLRFDPLVKKCTTFILRNMGYTNVIDIHKFGDHYNFLNLVQRSLEFMSENFEDFFRDDVFLAMDENLFKDLLSRDELKCSSELEVLNSIFRWIDYNNVARKASAPALMSTIRFKYPQKHNFSDEMLTKNSPKYDDLINDFFTLVKRYENSGEGREPINIDCRLSKLLSDKQMHPRRPHEIVFVIGGWSGRNPSDSIEVFNPITYQWYMPGSSLPRNSYRIYYAAVEMGGIMYIIGGFDNEHRGLKSNWAFNPNTGKWDEKAPMLQARCYASAVACDDRIFVLGGYDESVPMNANQQGQRFRSVERYNPNTNRWNQCQSMICIRSDAAAVYFQGKIYCIGGFTGQFIHRTVEFCEPSSLRSNSYNRTNQTPWQLTASMICKRSGVSCEVAGSYIYAVGGFDGENQLDSIERYNPEIDRWEEIAKMLTPRSNMGLLYINNRLLIVGGYGNEYTTPNCEEFDPNTSECVPIENLPMPEGCSGIKLVTAKGFNITRQYT